MAAAAQVDDLPDELILKIFSYLPQRSLATIAKVSERWKKLAFDPVLWTEVCIDARGDPSAKQVREILDRATMIRKLDVSVGTVSLEAVASASSRFRLMNELAIPGRALSHHVMPSILRNCASLSTIVLCGQDMLLPNDVRILEALSSLKSLVASDDLNIPDDVLRQICVSCPRLERLELNSNQISRRDSWEFLERLQQLTSLSVTKISTGALLHASKSCPSLDSLEIGTLQNENGVSVAQALQGFLKLRALTVVNDCGSGWLEAKFRTPQCLEHFDVAELCMDEEQLALLVQNCRDTLRHVTVNAGVLADAALETLPSCANLESVSIYGLHGKSSFIRMLCKFPRLIRAQLNVETGAIEAIRQLASLVDILDRSRRGTTRLVLSAMCSCQDSQDAVVRAVWRFKDFLALNTNLSAQHIRELELQCDAIMAAKLFWLPCGNEVLREVRTSFPAISKTLKHLTLNLVAADFETGSPFAGGAGH